MDTEALDFEDIPHDDLTGTSDTRGLLGTDSSDSAEASGSQSVWSIEYYRVFFNVGTKDVMSRVARSMFPKSVFYQRNETPDLYGPFWIVTTLVVILAVTGNFASYIHFLPSDKNPTWTYDFEKVTIAASVFYTMITIVPIMVYFCLRRIGVTGPEPWLTHIISLYGYSFFPYVPAAIACVTPIDMIRWVVILLCFLISTFFLVRNIRSYFPVDGLDWDAQAKFKGTILLACIILGQAVVALVTKLYFFHYADITPFAAPAKVAHAAPAAAAPAAVAPPSMAAVAKAVKAVAKVVANATATGAAGSTATGAAGSTVKP